MRVETKPNFLLELADDEQLQEVTTETVPLLSSDGDDIGSKMVMTLTILKYPQGLPEVGSGVLR